MIPTRSFVFTSTEITSVTCQLINGVCFVTINGTGLVGIEPTPRTFVSVFSDDFLGIGDFMNTLDIAGFATMQTSVFLQPDLTFFGCPPTP